MLELNVNVQKSTGLYGSFLNWCRTEKVEPTDALWKCYKRPYEVQLEVERRQLACHVALVTTLRTGNLTAGQKVPVVGIAGPVRFPLLLSQDDLIRVSLAERKSD